MSEKSNECSCTGEMLPPGASVGIEGLPPKNTTPINRAALYLHKKGVPMWAIYLVAYLALIFSWYSLATVVSEQIRPVMNVVGCSLLAFGGLAAVLAKSEPVYTGRREGSGHTKWRAPIETSSYFMIALGGICVLVAAVKDPAFISSRDLFLQGLATIGDF